MNYISKYIAEEIDASVAASGGVLATLTDAHTFTTGCYICESISDFNNLANKDDLPKSLQDNPAAFIMIIRPFVQGRVLGIIFSNNYQVTYIGKSRADKSKWDLWTRVDLIRDDKWGPQKQVGTTSERPTSVENKTWFNGFTYFDTTINKLIVWTGTGWVDYMGNNV